MKTIGFCVPCYNEEKNIINLYDSIRKQMDKLDYNYKILFIDNKSTDNSRDILKKLSQKDNNVIVLFNTRNFGPARSSAYGFFNTPGDVVLTMACDLQDPPELIGEFIKKWEDGEKIVLGRKITSQEKKSMFAVRKLYYKLMRMIVEENDLDQVTGFGLYDRKVVNIMKKIYNPNPNFRFLITSLGFRVSFIDYDQPQRKYGKSSYNFFSYLDTAILSIIDNSNKPLRLMSYFSISSFIILFILEIFMLIFSIINHVLSRNISYLLIILILLFISIVMCLISIIGEYLGQVLEREKHMPLVVLEKSYNFSEEELNKGDSYD